MVVVLLNATFEDLFKIRLFFLCLGWRTSFFSSNFTSERTLLKPKPANNSRSSDKCPVNFSF